MTEVRECLICSTSVTVEVEGSTGLTETTLKNHTTIYFVVKKILEISEPTCIHLLKRLGNPIEWFSFCHKCSSTLMKAEAVFREIQKLEFQWKRLKNILEGKVYDCFSDRLNITHTTTEDLKIIAIDKVRKETVNRLKNGGWTEHFHTLDDDSIFLANIKVEVDDESYSQGCKLEIVNKSFDSYLQDGGPDLGPDPEEPPAEPCTLKIQVQTKSTHKRPSKSIVLKNGKARILSVIQGKKEKGKQRSNRSGRLVKLKYKLKKSDSDFGNYDNCKDSEDDDADYCPPPAHESDDSEDTDFDDELLESERKQISCTGGGFLCNLCQFECRTDDTLKDHKFLRHMSQHSFQCNLCPKVFAGIRSVRKHQRKGHGMQAVDLQCNYCGRWCPTADKRNNHENTCHREKLSKLHEFLCEVCSKTYHSLKNRTAHKKTCHGLRDPLTNRSHVTNLEERYNCTMVAKEILQFKCELCYRSCRTEEKLKEHMYFGHEKSKESKELPLECKECGKRYARTHMLEAHIASAHIKERNFICEVCNKAFLTSSGLQGHQKSSHGDENRKVECDQCGRLLCNAAALQGHIDSVHKKQYKFRCPICNSGYQTKSKLEQHLRWVHTEDRPEVCTICEKRFCNKSSLKKHMLSHGERGFKCKLCPKDYKTKFALARHERTEHIRSMDFHCDQCGRDFPTSDYLATHRYHVHNDRKRKLPSKVIVTQDVLQKYLSSNDTEIEQPQIKTESADETSYITNNRSH